MGNKFEDLVYGRNASGKKRPPTLPSIWRWLIDFLTADFQPRASFVAGLALGLRLG
jgi:FUN14 domain-containing protein 1